MPATAKNTAPSSANATALSAEVKKLRALRKHYDGNANVSITFTLNDEAASLLINELGAEKFLRCMRGRSYREEPFYEPTSGRKI